MAEHLNEPSERLKALFRDAPRVPVDHASAGFAILARELNAARERIAELEDRIKRAMDAAAGRWCEWGDRALGVAAILNPEEETDG